MIRRILFLLFISGVTAGICNSQAFIRTADLFSRPGSHGSLNIYQNSAIDTLISRYIVAQKDNKTADGKQGMKGWRIQIYYSSVRTAREESNKVMLQFINKFGDLKPYVQYKDPGWYMVRVGNYRTITEAYKDFMSIKKEFPDAYFVLDNIFFPDLVK
ncbi:MAG: SPOR domain-containing protein [Bacteroidia bacterium]|nr:SPOR domain-containing protein [Bacteroidia bacterium]